ncbi:FAD binding domain-containing protein [Cupriavidus oxalaticus]|jgi:carbon-monoxide dehydrogenase medium subunit|uniref:Molybdopterin dehydrogenase with FAD binding domain n=1 Tax=Cupriavidus oxalaticus TaxID=96344 RepID=A0A375G8L2_9BURK|nr:xanthine dehydrogenase family protein subunit M [Cupriavidus oxalaticus]QEZ47951.1 xanthine dehydrogenase family protein subunit M [Cupriavidus oxalaticus]QRQ87718.1 xanthine dehydrogenase family protein subunit M [Cupriavidus oxalaticus]QRQ93955.1 xanthine dehydrogenase family protein subunit M [Cupriavidus oxalaticus]WQD82588.1 xanthine dehydrogenase family protein subunit M [Cupriavidus oxalaticus]SPC15077.1 Molybdopterin dehydrogenase with FAD binding domain [Cupriavidus oxalaticus]
MRAFEYFEPATLAEASALLHRCGGRASVLAGGTDLLVQIKESVRKPEQVINIKKIPGMDVLTFDPVNGLRIGALVTTRAVETSGFVQRHYASLAKAVTDFASIQVRHRATVVGNVCRASPSADSIAPLVADRASVHLYGMSGSREVRVEDFITGVGKTAIAPDEIVTRITVPAPRADAGTGTAKVYLKHGRRVQMELATVGVAVSLTVDGGRCTDVGIVLAAVGPTPVRAVHAENLLREHPITDALILQAAHAAMRDARPISDVRASEAYRRQMVSVLTRRALEQALQQALEAATCEK